MHKPPFRSLPFNYTQFYSDCQYLFVFSLISFQNASNLRTTNGCPYGSHPHEKLGKGCLFLLVRLNQGNRTDLNATRMSVAGEGLTEPNHNHRPCRWYAQAPLGPFTSRAYRLIEFSFACVWCPTTADAVRCALRPPCVKGAVTAQR